MTTTTTNKVTFSTFQDLRWGNNGILMTFHNGGDFHGFIEKHVSRSSGRVNSYHVEFFSNDGDERWFDVLNGNARSVLTDAKNYVRQVADRRATVGQPQNLTGYSWPR